MQYVCKGVGRDQEATKAQQCWPKIVRGNYHALGDEPDQRIVDFFLAPDVSGSRCECNGFGDRSPGKDEFVVKGVACSSDACCLIRLY